MSNFLEIFLRLNSELARITPQTISDRTDISRATIYNWMNRGNVPMDKLKSLSDAGVNVEYVLTGSDGREPALTSDERELLSLFRAAPLAVKAAAIGALQGGSQRAAPRDVIAIGGVAAGRNVKMRGAKIGKAQK